MHRKLQTSVTEILRFVWMRPKRSRSCSFIFLALVCRSIGMISSTGSILSLNRHLCISLLYSIPHFYANCKFFIVKTLKKIFSVGGTSVSRSFFFVRYFKAEDKKLVNEEGFHLKRGNPAAENPQRGFGYARAGRAVSCPNRNYIFST